MTMKKSKYEKPAMRVYEMKQQPQLLQTSTELDVTYYQEDI